MVREGKSVVWTGTSLETLRAFPAPARRAVGHELMRVQQGLMPTDWKAMSDIGHGVYEIRVHVGPR